MLIPNKQREQLDSERVIVCIETCQVRRPLAIYRWLQTCDADNLRGVLRMVKRINVCQKDPSFRVAIERVLSLPVSDQETSRVQVSVDARKLPSRLSTLCEIPSGESCLPSEIRHITRLVHLEAKKRSRVIQQNALRPDHLVQRFGR